MPTDGKCIICGYRAPLSSFISAAGNGELLPEYIKLPQVVQQPFYRYLALFRPKSGCACSDSKIIRLTREMVALVQTGYVAQQGKVDRPCPPALWAMGMERMLEQAATLTLPMKNHNYLRSIVWQLADQVDAGRERSQHQQILNGNARAHRDDPPGKTLIEQQYEAQHGTEMPMGAMPPAVQAAIEKMREKLQANGGKHAAE